MADTPRIVPLVVPPPSSRLGGNTLGPAAPIRTAGPVSHNSPVLTHPVPGGDHSSLPGPAREAPGGNKAS